MPKAKASTRTKTKSAPAKKTATSSKKKPAAKPAKKAVNKAAQGLSATTGDKLTFNHAMIYTKDVVRSLAFYRDLLGFRLIEEFKHEGISLYARLHAPGGEGTIALHLAGPGTPMASEGVRLYFEIHDLDGFCQKLQKKGFYITQMPRVMPWGWRHAYLNDPDGHEISLYWAGEMRMQKTVMQAARTVERTPTAKAR
jgi:catechol 2,3-dioxygenase-like lactoylglutathione lyase family enzyme